MSLVPLFVLADTGHDAAIADSGELHAALQTYQSNDLTFFFKISHQDGLVQS